MQGHMNVKKIGHQFIHCVTLLHVSTHKGHLQGVLIHFLSRVNKIPSCSKSLSSMNVTEIPVTVCDEL